VEETHLNLRFMWGNFEEASNGLFWCVFEAHRSMDSQQWLGSYHFTWDYSRALLI